MTVSVVVTTVGDLRKAIEQLPDDRPILAQVVATNGQAWNMEALFTAQPHYLKWASILTLKHDDLARLPPESFTSPQTASTEER